MWGLFGRVSSGLAYVALETNDAATAAFRRHHTGAERIKHAAELDAQQGAMLHSRRRHVPAAVQPVSNRRLCSCLHDTSERLHIAEGTCTQNSSYCMASTKGGVCSCNSKKAVPVAVKPA